MSRVNIAVFVVYVLCFCIFTLRFGAQVLPRVERLLWLAAAAGVAPALCVPPTAANEVFAVVWVGFVVVFFVKCVQFQWHAWRPRAGGRDPQHMLLALCWLAFVVVGVHDLMVIFKMWQVRETWSAIAAPVTTVCMALLLGGRLAGGMGRIKRFNQELEEHVVVAPSELAQALEREHVQELNHAKL